MDKRRQKWAWADSILMGSLAMLGIYIGHKLYGSFADEPKPEYKAPVAVHAGPPKAEKPAPKIVDETPLLYRTIKAKVTAYCPCTGCCGPNARGITGSGDAVAPYDGVAAATDAVKYRTKIDIFLPDGTVLKKEVDDTGGDMRKAWKEGKYHFDVRVPSHEQAKKFGVYHDAEVRIYDKK